MQPSDLSQFTGTELWHRHPLNRRFTYTDGVAFFAEQAKAYWLLDIFATELAAPLKQADGMLFVTCKVEGSSAELSAVRDGGEPLLWRRRIDFTDCPEGEWKFYVAEGGPAGSTVIMLPSEY
jgi:hypothetical protein